MKSSATAEFKPILFYRRLRDRVCSLTPDEALHLAVSQGLSILGESTQDALMGQLAAEGFVLSTGIDPQLLDAKLAELFGAGSDAIMRVIYERFVLNLARAGAMPCIEPSATESIAAVLKASKRN